MREGQSQGSQDVLTHGKITVPACCKHSKKKALCYILMLNPKHSRVCEQRWDRAWSCLLALSKHTCFLCICRLFIPPAIILLPALPADHPRFIPTMVISLLLCPSCFVGSRRSKVNSPQVLDSHTLDLRSWTFCCFFLKQGLTMYWLLA